MTQVFVRLFRDDSGQDLIEYALLAGFISLVAVATITLVGKSVDTVYGKVDTKLKTIP
jgi:pilus assembly protein Flp/PilA